MVLFMPVQQPTMSSEDRKTLHVVLMCITAIICTLIMFSFISDMFDSEEDIAEIKTQALLEEGRLIRSSESESTKLRLDVEKEKLRHQMTIDLMEKFSIGPLAAGCLAISEIGKEFVDSCKIALSQADRDFYIAYIEKTYKNRPN